VAFNKLLIVIVKVAPISWTFCQLEEFDGKSDVAGLFREEVICAGSNYSI
jgi:hypothetical protein